MKPLIFLLIPVVVCSGMYALARGSAEAGAVFIVGGLLYLYLGAYRSRKDQEALR